MNDLGISSSPASSASHLVDLHVGLRIRMRRRELGITQQQLAAAIGLTFPQVQKYERASNRVSASKLWEIARALWVPVEYFYHGFDDRVGRPVWAALTNSQLLLLTADGLELAKTFSRLAEPTLRRMVIDLIRTIAERDATPR